MASFAFGQRTITGLITNADGEPLIGANVLVVGNPDYGTITDFEGNFELNVPEDAEQIKVSYIGYEPRNIDLTESDNYQVTLREGGVALDEVVVVAFGEKPREQLTGSVATVQAKDIEQIPLGTFDQVLQGQAPGLLVLGGSGQPGAQAGNVTIRGQGSITGGTTPLYIMDGIPISPAAFKALNPNNIENISVLKDASATAMYGSRGANGVIMITTKSGKSGAPQIQYRGQVGYGTFTQPRFEMMNSTQKLAFEEKARRGPGWVFSRENPNNANLSEEQLAEYDMILDSLRGINTNWREAILNNGITNSHELNISGGDETTTYFLSGQFFDQTGQIRDSRLTRGNVRFNLDNKTTDWLTLGLRGALGYTESKFIEAENAVNLNNPFAFIFLANPYEQIYLDEDEEVYQFGATGRNPIENLELNDDRETTYKGIISTYLDADLSSILEGLTFRTNWGVDFYNDIDDDYINPDSRLSLTVQGQQGSLRRNSYTYYAINGTNTLNYVKRFGADDRHKIDFLAGQEWFKRSIRSFNFTGYGLTAGLKTVAGTTQGSEESPEFIPNIGGTTTDRTLLSYFGRADYTLDDKYNLSLSIRRDASSRFGANFRWGTFWNVGGSWNIGREGFLAGSNVVNDLILSANYGTVGNTSGIDDFQYLGVYNVGDYAGQSAIIPNPAQPNNPDLKWEVAQMLNIGIEATLYNRIRARVDLYNNITSDLFISTQLSRTTGSTDLNTNAGKMRNRGIEGLLSVDVIKGEDIYWSIGGNIAYNDNEILDLFQVEEFEQGTSIIREGLPLGSHYVVGYEGVDASTGNPLYLDGDQNVTDEFSDDNRLAIFGTWQPPVTGGVNTTFQWGNLSVSAMGSFVSGNVIFNNQTFFQENPTFAQFNQLETMTDVWEEPGDVTEHQRIGTSRQFSSKDLEDGSFFRLRNATIAYQFEDLINSPAVKGLRVYVQATNLFTFTNFTGLDPEIDNNIAQYEYPPQRTFTLGVDLTL
jgi:TonB-linked SusC/RagA family outer membrane protein